MKTTANIFLSLALCFLSFTFYSQQNLVINPSFESYTACPTSSDEVYKTVGWYSFAYTPDYYNSCAPSGMAWASTPLNFSGYQAAASGVAYSGLTTYVSATQIGMNNYREYLAGTLTSSLNIGTKYYMSFKTNLSLYYPYKLNCASDKIGMKFSKTKYVAGSPPPPDNQAKLYSSTIITDTLNWTKIFGSFVSDSAYNYLIIGNFFSDNNTDTLIKDNSPDCKFSYYFIDDVCVSTDSLFTLNYIPNEIEENSFKSNFKIYPNPFDNYIFINSEEMDYDIKIYSMYGTELFSFEKIKDKKFKIDVSGINLEILFINIKNKNNVLNYKLTKK